MRSGRRNCPFLASRSLAGLGVWSQGMRKWGVENGKWKMEKRNCGTRDKGGRRGLSIGVTAHSSGYRQQIFWLGWIRSGKV